MNRVEKQVGCFFLGLFLLAGLAVGAHAETASYTYDKLNRLTNASFTDGGHASTMTYQYDSAGNILRVTSNRLNSAPVFSALSNQVVAENSQLSFLVSASDPEGDSVSISASPLPQGAVFNGSTFTWTPSFEQAGDYSVTFTASDGLLSTNQSITISVANTMQDTDGDGIADDVDVDDDNDGLPDTWEIANGLNPKDPKDAIADNDHDGFTNLMEYQNNTSPTAFNRSSSWSDVPPSSHGMTLFGSLTIDGQPAAIGDEVAVYDPDGVLCGHFIVDATASYGNLYVNGDDPTTTDVDEGAVAGDTLTINIWDSSTQRSLDVVSVPTPVSWTDGATMNVDLQGIVTNNYLVPLRAGWNLVSLPLKTVWYVGATPMVEFVAGSKLAQVTSIGDVFASIAGKYTLVRGFDQGGTVTYDPNLDDSLNSLKYLGGGYGVWIKMSEPGVLDLSDVQ